MTPEPRAPAADPVQLPDPGAPLAQAPAPLAGVRIIAVEQYGAGPMATMYLADMGAEIIRIEDPGVGGDVSRYIPPGQSGTDSLFHEAFNRGKRSLLLDLKTAAGREVLERLVGEVDAVFSNLRGDQVERLGLSYERLGAINPRIVCVALTGYGRSGPDAGLPAYDPLIQAAAGWAAMTGEPDGPPTKSGLSLADYVAGLTAALGLVSGVLDARATGRGRDVDVNLYDAALAMLSYRATWYLSAGVPVERQPLSAHPSVVPFQFFATGDGHVAVACAKEKFFRALLDELGLGGLVDDARFANFEGRWEHRHELVEILGAAFAARTTEACVSLLRGRVPIAAVRGIDGALNLDELTERQMLAEYDHPSLGQVRSVGLPIRFGGFEPDYRPAPGLAADADAIMRSLGYDEAEVQRLRDEGAFG